MNTPSPRRKLLIASVALASLGVSGCGSNVTADADTSAAESQAGYPLTLTNCERDVVVEKAPERIVGLMPSQTELLVSLGLGDRLVAQAQTATRDLPEDVAAEVAGVPTISTETPPSREDLLEVQPDAVVAPTTYEFTAEQGFATVEQLQQAGAIAYVATGGCSERRATAKVDDLFTDIENLGQIFGVPDAAKKLGEQTEKRLTAVDDAISGGEKPKVAQLYIEGDSVSAIGAGVEYDIIKRAGGDNVFEPDEDLFKEFFAATISPEEVAARNPEVIVFAVSDDAHEKEVRGYLKKTFPTVTAVAEDRLVAIPASDLYPGTMGNVTAVETLAAALYPSRL